MEINQNSSEVVSLTEAQSYTHAFQNQNPEAIKAYFAGIDKIKLILEQEGCIGIRFYNGYDLESEKANLVLVGVNEAGEDMELDTILERLFTCPPICAHKSSLML
ncbi:MAG TPA: hypothetical protein VLZ83_10605 [Edaphocola sp.]|nr:hypothetical protein [Edaphocola sp.]